jgi:predicted amidophosphoribosyltransferase
MQKHTIEELIEDVEYEQLCYKDEIIEILEKQVAKKPTDKMRMFQTTPIQASCPKCKARVGEYDKYCHNCGQKLDWSDT